MFKGKFGRKSQKSYEDIQYTCTIRFLDDSEPITVTFQVSFCYKQFVIMLL